jgi:hypothetical protein
VAAHSKYRALPPSEPNASVRISINTGVCPFDRDTFDSSLDNPEQARVSSVKRLSSTPILIVAVGGLPEAFLERAVA